MWYYFLPSEKSTSESGVICLHVGKVGPGGWILSEKKVNSFLTLIIFSFQHLFRQRSCLETHFYRVHSVRVLVLVAWGSTITLSTPQPSNVSHSFILDIELLLCSSQGIHMLTERLGCHAFVIYVTDDGEDGIPSGLRAPETAHGVTLAQSRKQWPCPDSQVTLTKHQGFKKGFPWHLQFLFT